MIDVKIICLCWVIEVISVMFHATILWLQGTFIVRSPSRNPLITALPCDTWWMSCNECILWLQGTFIVRSPSRNPLITALPCDTWWMSCYYLWVQSVTIVSQCDLQAGTHWSLRWDIICDACLATICEIWRINMHINFTHNETNRSNAWCKTRH